MRRFLLLALLALPMPALSQAVSTQPSPAPLVRTVIDPPEGAVVGQGVAIDISVLFPDEMLRPPLVKLPEALGAQIFRFQSQGLTIRDRIDGRDYVGQTFEFMLFPRRGGTIDIPAASVTLLDGNGDAIGTVQGAPSSIVVTVPPGMDASGPVLASDAVQVRQEWSPDPGSAKLGPGGAIVRTIRRQVDGVPALGMAEFVFNAPEGVRVYVDPPLIEDRTDRGQVTGQRTDKVTYIFEKAGRYELPTLSQPWWSLSDEQARMETLPGIALTVSAAARPETLRLAPSGTVAAGLCILLVAGLLALSARRLAAIRHQAISRYRSSERYARQRLKTEALSGSPVETYRALNVWKARLPKNEASQLDRDVVLGPHLTSLEGHLFAGQGNWGDREGRALAAALGRRERTGTARVTTMESPLPALNPSHER